MGMFPQAVAALFWEAKWFSLCFPGVLAVSSGPGLWVRMSLLLLSLMNVSSVDDRT